MGLSDRDFGHIFFPMESDEANDRVCKVYMAICSIPDYETFMLVTNLLSLIDVGTALSLAHYCMIHAKYLDKNIIVSRYLDRK